MELSQKHKDILEAKTCPYCDSKTKTITETDVYGKEYQGRSIIACSNFPKCDSYVGTHDNGKPLGRLANRELRQWKIKGHDAFDKIWKDKKMKRGKCYIELSEALNIPNEYTHIGMFSIKTIKQVIAWSKLKYAELI